MLELIAIFQSGGGFACNDVIQPPVLFFGVLNQSLFDGTVGS